MPDTAAPQPAQLHTTSRCAIRYEAHSEDWRRGYDAQAAWLAARTLKDAEIALPAREATLEPNEYNQGGTHATRDFIEARRGT